MNADQLFSAANMFALAGWMLLVAVPYWKFTQKIIFNGILILLSIVYAYLIVAHWGETPDAGFSSLQQVSNLFQNHNLLLAGWIHYLTFDLLAGLFIINNAALHHVNRLLVIPCLLLTFMFGPCGLLLYVLLRTMKAKNYFAQNF